MIGAGFAGAWGMRFLVIIVLPLALGGCITTQQRAAQTSSGLSSRQQAYYNLFISQGLSKEDALLAAVNPTARQLFFDDKTCRSYGAAPGSDAYVACRTQLEVSHRAPQPAAAPASVVIQAPPPRLDPPPPVTCMTTGTLTSCNQAPY
jgi:hypothetical protein